MDDCAGRYGDMFTLRITNEGTWVFITHPDAVRQVFTGDPRLFHAGEANIVLLPVLGSHSVLLLDDDAHMAQRKLMLPSFHGERMRSYEQTMAEVAAREIERWPAGEPLPAWPTMQAITLEVIMRTVFGVRDTARSYAAASRGSPSPGEWPGWPCSARAVSPSAARSRPPLSPPTS
jgi:cytochrome P450 family 135